MTSKNAACLLLGRADVFLEKKKKSYKAYSYQQFIFNLYWNTLCCFLVDSFIRRLIAFIFVAYIMAL